VGILDSREGNPELIVQPWRHSIAGIRVVLQTNWPTEVPQVTQRERIVLHDVRVSRLGVLATHDCCAQKEARHNRLS
jgi:hypothetical protein